MNTFKNFNEAYLHILRDIEGHGEDKTNRKGEDIKSLRNYSFTIENILGSFASCRPGISFDYLMKEFAWYMSGSLKLEDAVACSKFWEKCSDDGKTVNSNYGYLLFHKRNESGFTQFEHAVNCLINNVDSKKAVLSLYSAEHAYMSNDNPCSMFLNLYVSKGKLNMTAVMRSNDINFGTPYDVPFFCFVMWAAYKKLKEQGCYLELGTYTHLAMDLHKYESRGPSIEAVSDNRNEEIIGNLEAHEDLIKELYMLTYENFFDGKTSHEENMARARLAAEHSKCLKKKVGAVLAGEYDGEEYYFESCGGRNNNIQCETCARDTGEKFYSDGCYSVHGEMNCIVWALKDGQTDFTGWVMYTTHGPCDQCLKLCDLVGIKTVIYEHDYKTDYTHWPNIEVLKLSEL